MVSRPSRCDEYHRSYNHGSDQPELYTSCRPLRGFYMMWIWATTPNRMNYVPYILPRIPAFWFHHQWVSWISEASDWLKFHRSVDVHPVSKFSSVTQCESSGSTIRSADVLLLHSHFRCPDMSDERYWYLPPVYDYMEWGLRVLIKC